jgi:cytochrome P450
MSEESKTLRIAPGPQRPFAGNLRAAVRDSIGLYEGATAQYGPIVRFAYAKNRAWHLVSDPAGVEWVLQGNFKNYPKGFFFSKRLRLLTGDGLFSSEGDFWLRQRRLAQPAFHRARLAQLVAVMTGATREMLHRWEKQPSAEPLNVSEEGMWLTLQVVGLALFKAALGNHAGEIYQSLTRILDYINYRMQHPFAPPENIPTPRNRTFLRDKQTLDDLALNVIRARRQSGRDEGDLLSMLMQARDEDSGEGMSDRQLLDEVRTIMLAGHETTAVALAWTWKLLSEHPEARVRLENEVDDVLNGREPQMEDLEKLRFTRAVFEEALRLYPPVWLMARQAAQDDEIGGFHIPAGSTIALSPYITQRLPELWPEPQKFNPDRFMPGAAPRPKFAYFPFGGGPRLCIGQNFALMEAQIILALTAQRFRLEMVPGQKIELAQTLTLRPKSNLMMTLQRR